MIMVIKSMFRNSKLLFPLFLFLLASIITKAEEIKNGYETRNYGDFSLTGKFKNGKPDGVMEYSSSDGTKKTYFYADGVIQENEIGGIEVAKYKCEKIGFKKQTEKFANCVMDLYKRNNPIAQSNLNQSKVVPKQLQSCGESKILPCYGEWVWKDGSKYVGDFKDGKFNGQGTIYHPDGSVKEKGIYVNDYLVSSPEETKLLSQPRQEMKSSPQSTNYAQEQNNTKDRRRGIDSINCEAYAKNSTSNQRATAPAGPAGLGTIFALLAQDTLINMNTQDYYDSCMKRLGY